MTTRTLMMAGAAALALTGPAAAFDQVNWKWHGDVDTYVDVKADFHIDTHPKGMVMIEGMQAYIGDVKAESRVGKIYNNPPHQPFIDGAWLPEITSDATAVANNANVESSVGVQAHLGQFAYGGGDVDGIGDVLALAGSLLFAGHLAHNDVSGNLVGAALLGSMATLDLLEKTKVEAKSEVVSVLNSTVASSATAVVNNAAIEVRPDQKKDSWVVGDVVQFAYADTTARSSVEQVNLYNFTTINPTAIGRPIVASNATAVGNNLSITVKAPK